MSQRKKKLTAISAEKMAILAEKGLHKARLSNAEKIALAEGALDEFYNIKESIKTTGSPIDRKTIVYIMGTFFPPIGKSADNAFIVDISVEIKQTPMKVLKNSIGWLPASPVFAQR